MERDHWIRVKEILTEAIEQPPAGREAFVREACGDDGALVQDVMRLLDGHNHAGQALSQPLFPVPLSEQPEQPPRFSPSMIVARRFRIVRLIARGGMGDVYEAEDTHLGVRVALKTIRPDIAADGRMLDLFMNEIQTARSVTHPNVCRIYDLSQHSEPAAGGSEQVTLFLTMELLEGETLSQYLKTHGAFDRDQALALIGQLAAALQAAHQAGIIHRDFKPGNVMLARSADGELRAAVTDFGLAVARAQVHSQPLPDAAGGTPEYMAPEQTCGGAVTPATDVYALGLVIAELIGSRVHSATVSRAPAIPQPGTAASHIALSLPENFRGWKPVLLRCLEPDPAKRYLRPIEVSEALVAASTRPPVLTRVKTLASLCGLLLAILALTAFITQRYGEWPAKNQTTYRTLGPDVGSIGLWHPSPDGRYFVVTDWNTGNLGLRDIASGEIRLLKNKADAAGGGQASYAVFSPDSSRIAYCWSQNNGWQLRVHDISAGTDTLLYSDPELSYCEIADWSPDGSRIVSHLRREVRRDESQIAVISVADHSILFPLPSGRYGSVVFAPDSAHIVFSAPQSPQTLEEDIYEVSIYGGLVSDLVKDPADDYVIGFSRDGRRLVFSSDRMGTFGVWSVAFSGDSVQGDPSVLANDLGRASVLGLTQDGALYYTVTTDSVDVYTAEIDVLTGRLLSGPNNVVKRFRGEFMAPSWSPDGRRLSFASKLSRLTELWVYSRETGEIHPLQPGLTPLTRPQWDPSGDRIFAKGTDRTGAKGIFRVDANTGVAELAIDERTLNGNEGAWARDGRTLFNRFKDASLGLFRLDTQTLQRTVLYVPTPNLDLDQENLALSPDGSTLAFQLREPASSSSSLMVMPAAGGPARPLLTIQQPETFQFGAFAWTADSTQILVAKTRDGSSELWLVPINGGSARKVDFPAMRITQMRMSSDGRTIAFVSGTRAGEVWVAENFLPKE